MRMQVNGSFEVLKGPPADTKASISAALCSKTKADGAAAIVIGSASRGGLQEALLGSIAANLAHNCDVPVVVLHKPREPSTGPAGKAAGKGQHAPGDVTWLLRASTQEILGEVTAEQQLEAAAGEQQVRVQGRSLLLLWQQIRSMGRLLFANSLLLCAPLTCNEESPNKGVLFTLLQLCCCFVAHRLSSSATWWWP